MASQPIFRFAPSPNGWLHVGHAYSALFTDRAARSLGGVMLLRIEDIDVARCKPEYDAAIMEDLRWLGLAWPEPVLRQAERFPIYQAAADELRDRDLLYPCFCSRGEVAVLATGADLDGAPLYPGTCRRLAAKAIHQKLAHREPVQWRLRTDAALVAAGGDLAIDEIPVAGHDLIPSRQSRRAADPRRWGDVVLVRKDIPTSYHLSVVVDDAAQGVTHVSRGMDLYPATDIHVLLQRLLGLPSPVYAHHDLIIDTAARKLGKSAGAPALRLLREAGWTPARLREQLGFRGS